MSDTRRTPNPESLLAIIRLQNEVAVSRLDLESVMRVVVDRAGPLTAANGAVIELVEGDEMVYRAVSGTASRSLGLRLERQGSLSGLCVEQNAPLRADDTETDPRVDREACRRVGVRSMICVPLMYQGAAVGVLKVLYSAPRRLTEDIVAVLALLAETVAASMQHAKDYEVARHDSLHDGLTNLPNRRAFDECLPHQIARTQRDGHALSVAVLDLDGFKAANDRWGHATGDDVLRRVAEILRAAIRGTDFCFRLGGDEFAIIMPSTSPSGALSVIERIRSQIPSAALADGTIGISAGVVGAAGENARQLVAAADRALYVEKRRKQRQTRTTQPRGGDSPPRVTLVESDRPSAGPGGYRLVRPPSVRR